MNGREYSRGLVVALVASLAAPAGADLAVMTTGYVMKVRGYRVEGDRVWLEPDFGGRIKVPLLHVERIVDDEVVDPEAIEIEKGSRDLRYRPRDLAGIPFGDEIRARAEGYDFDPALVASIIRAESSFRPEVVSPKGARGLMQLMPATAERFGVSASYLFDPAWNLEAGLRYLTFLRERFVSDLPRMLAAYNAGEGAVDRYGGIPPYRETQGYVERVLSSLDAVSTAGR